MDVGLSPARQVRSQHRHELRTLTYVTLDEGNGGIVRNLSKNGIGVQVVAAVPPRQQLRVRFELRFPRVQVETRAEVMWATFSGQCGIRFLDMSPAMGRRITEWILGDLLESISLHAESSGSILPGLTASATVDANHGKDSLSRPLEAAVVTEAEDDGLMISSTPLKVIEMPARNEPPPDPELGPSEQTATEVPPDPLDWLSQPLSGRTLAWTVDGQIVLAALLLFTLVFLSVARETPPWPFAMVAAASLAMAGIYWGFFRFMAGASLGVRLARIAERKPRDESEPRFR